MSWTTVPEMQEALLQKSMFRRSINRSILGDSLESLYSTSDSAMILVDETLREENILSPMENVVIITVLEKGVDQLSVIGSLLNAPLKRPKFLYAPLRERLNAPEYDNKVIDTETNQLKKVALEKMRLKKVQQDRGFLEKTLYNTIQELKSNGSYEFLANAVVQDFLEDAEEVEFLLHHEQNVNELKSLRKQLKKESKDVTASIYEKDEEIATIKDEIQDIIFCSELQLQYIDHWERARYEQHVYKLQGEEQELKNKIFQLKIKTDIECRVNTENETFIQECESKLESDILEWNKRYVKEIEEKDIEIQVLKERRAANLKELEDLALLYESHKRAIKDYLEARAERERIAAHELHINFMATRIQAWWRGTMVRRGLGPFRKKIEKDKKGGKKKKK